MFMSVFLVNLAFLLFLVLNSNWISPELNFFCCSLLTLCFYWMGNKRWRQRYRTRCIMQRRERRRYLILNVVTTAVAWNNIINSGECNLQKPFPLWHHTRCASARCSELCVLMLSAFVLQLMWYFVIMPCRFVDIMCHQNTDILCIYSTQCDLVLQRSS